jgi:ABC-type Mn2+/Zn2+ transport system permease subunit
MIIFIICGLVLAYLLYRAFPRTGMAILMSIAIVGWMTFAKNQDVSETMATALAGLIVIAFGADVLLRVRGVFRK